MNQEGMLVIWKTVASAGIGAILLGPVVAWFAMRLEKILSKLVEAVERNTISNMLSVLNTKHIDDALSTMCEKTKREAEDALRK